MRALRRNWTSPNEWLLKEAATVLCPRERHAILNSGAGVVDHWILVDQARLLIGRVVLTRRQPKKRGRGTEIRCVGTVECACVITASNKFYPIPVVEDQEDDTGDDD